MGKLISLIYFYVISAISIGVMIFAAFSWGNLILNSTMFEQYPLRYGVANCEGKYPSYNGVYPVMDSGTKEATISAEDREELRKQCVVQSEYDRKQHRLEDIRDSVVSTLVGVVLFLLHFPQAKKLSKDK